VDPSQEVVERVFGERIAFVQEVEIRRVDRCTQLCNEPEATRVGKGKSLRVHHLFLFEFIFFDLCREWSLVIDLLR
jgi:hypothetical protein